MASSEDGEWYRCLGTWLEVGSFCLDEAHEDVLRIHELVLVENVMFDGSSNPGVLLARLGSMCGLTYSQMFPTVLSHESPRPA